MCLMFSMNIIYQIVIFISMLTSDMGVLTLLFGISVASVTLTLAMSDCRDLGNCYSIGEIQLDMDTDGDTISLSWRVNSTEFIYGYKVVIRESEDNTYIYESPVLNKHAEHMQVKQELDGVEAKVCLVVLLNETETATEKCEEIKTSDLQMVVGILAGVVFLVPCITALIFIIYKDRQVVKAIESDFNETKVLIAPIKDIKIVIDGEMPQTSIITTGKVNECFVNDDASANTDSSETDSGRLTTITEESVDSAKKKCDPSRDAAVKENDKDKPTAGKEDIKTKSDDEKTADQQWINDTIATIERTETDSETEKPSDETDEVNTQF